MNACVHNHILHWRSGKTAPQTQDAPVISEKRSMRLTRMIGDGIDWILFRGRAELLSQQEQWRNLARAVAQSPASVIITDVRGTIEYVNPRFSKISGYSAAEVLGENVRMFKSGRTPPEAYGDLWRTILNGCEWRGEFHNKKKSGESYWEFASISPIEDETGRVTHFVSVQEDITERKRIEAERETLIGELREALAHVNTLRGLLPICSWCKKIRDDRGYWEEIERFVATRSGAHFSHGICPSCATVHFQEHARRLAALRGEINAPAV
jgi:PAS domain S-box-containing protein